MGDAPAPTFRSTGITKITAILNLIMAVWFGGLGWYQHNSFAANPAATVDAVEKMLREKHGEKIRVDRVGLQSRLAEGIDRSYYISLAIAGLLALSGIGLLLAKKWARIPVLLVCLAMALGAFTGAKEMMSDENTGQIRLQIVTLAGLSLMVVLNFISFRTVQARPASP